MFSVRLLINSDLGHSSGTTPAAAMVVRRLVLLLMMMAATRVVAESPTSVTDGELAKVVVEKTSKFLEGPTGRALSIQDRFQGWINSLENRISDIAYNAVNRATTAISRISFFETYFSQYQSQLPSLQREPPKPKEPPVLYLYPQSPQYLYHDDVQPPLQDSFGQSTSRDTQQVEQNILAPDTEDDYHDQEDENSLYPQEISPILSPYYQPPNVQALKQYRDTLKHYQQSQNSSPHVQEHYLQAQEQKSQAQKPNPQQQDHYLQDQKPNPHAQEHYLQAQEPNPQLQEHYLQAQKPNPQSQGQYPQLQEQYLSAQQKLLKSVQLQDLSPTKFHSPSVQLPVVSSAQQNPSILLPPIVPQPPQVNRDVASPLQLLANSQANKGSVPEAIKRVFIEDGGEPPSVQGVFGQPNIAGDGSYSSGPYYPDPVEGGFTLAPAARYPPPKSSLRSNNEVNPATKPTFTQNLRKYTPEQYSSPLSAYNPLTPPNNPLPSFSANNPLPSLSANNPLPLLSANNPVIHLSANNPLPPISANNPLPPISAYNPLQPISSSNPLPAFAANSPTQPLSVNNNQPLSSYRPTPRHAYRTDGKSHEDLVNAENSDVNASENSLSSASLSKRRRSAQENFSIWNLFTDNSAPTALYCPSGGVRLLLCAGDQLFDEYVKAPIESAKDWVSKIDLHLYDL